MMTELKLLDGASFYVQPHAVLAIGPAETCPECNALASSLFLAGGRVEVAGAVEEVRATLFPPPISREEEPDDVLLFLDSCTTRGEDKSVSARDLFEAYSTWSQENAFGYPSQTDFARSLRKMGIQAGAGRVRSYAGLDLNDGIRRAIKRDRIR